MRFLSSDELLRLAHAMDDRYRPFVLLGGFGGLRLGEMLGLRWGKVDLLRRRVHVAETLVDIAGHISFGPPKTRAAVRSVPVPQFVSDELARLATANIGADQLVFQSPEGMPVRATLFRRRFWAPAVDEAGLSPLRIHDLRHTAVSLWIADCANPKQVAAMAGHTSVWVVFDRYGHLYPHQDDEIDGPFGAARLRAVTVRSTRRRRRTDRTATGRRADRRAHTESHPKTRPTGRDTGMRSSPHAPSGSPPARGCPQDHPCIRRSRAVPGCDYRMV